MFLAECSKLDYQVSRAFLLGRCRHFIIWSTGSFDPIVALARRVMTIADIFPTGGLCDHGDHRTTGRYNVV
jgi:hypothetical protein